MKFDEENSFKKIDLSLIFNIVTKQRLKDTCGLFFEILYFNGLLGCPFEY